MNYYVNIPNGMLPLCLASQVTCLCCADAIWEVCGHSTIGRTHSDARFAGKSGDHRPANEATCTGNEDMQWVKCVRHTVRMVRLARK